MFHYPDPFNFNNGAELSASILLPLKMFAISLT